METPALGDIGLLATTLKKEDCAIVISYSGNNMAHTTMGIHKIEQGVLLETPRWINSEETEVKG